MSKIVDPAQRLILIPTQVILCILVGCLALHFLVDKTLLSSRFPLHAPSTQGISGQALEELEHTDDLVAPSNLPDDLVEEKHINVIPPILPVQKQAVAPIHHPPQI
jgi:hypothetical protein